MVKVIEQLRSDLTAGNAPLRLRLGVKDRKSRRASKAHKIKTGLRSVWECGHLYHTRIENRITVDEPLVLISQIARSGGTLLSRLFDAHPQCHAHPWELHIGYPDDTTWPVPNLQDHAGSWFDTLYEWHVSRAFRKGYSKGLLYGKENGEQSDIYPFLIPPLLQKTIFQKCVASTQIKSQRDVFNCYMTSYFNAWLDNHNLYGHSKKFVTAFAAGMNMKEGNLQKFFEVYPDGRFVSIIRDPKSWYASARKHKEVYGNIEEAIRFWSVSTKSAMAAKECYGERVYIMSFEDLLSDTEASMQSLSAYLGVDFLPTLIEPTFNGFPIKANSRYSLNRYGITQEPLSRYKELLTSDEITYIDRQTRDLYTHAQ